MKQKVSINPRSSRAIATTAIAALMLSPALADAQGGVTPAKVRTGVPLRNSCLQLKFMPSPMVRSPEGFAIVKMQRELNDLRDLLITNRAADSSSNALKQVFTVNSGVDSIVRFFTSTTDGTSRTITVRLQAQGDGQRTAPAVTDRMLTYRMMIESMIREIQPRVDEVVRDGMVMMGTINIQSTAPGYLGVTTSTSTFPSVLDESRSFGYCDYPRIETVDPGSPAEKVGLSAGDTLLAYNNLDLLQHDVNYQSLLIPGQPLRIKYRREGQVREVMPVIARREPRERVFVAARPSCVDPSLRAECEAPQLVTARFGPFPARANGAQGNAAPMTVRMVPSILYPISPSEAFFGGAQLRVISEAFGKNLGLTAGLLVWEVDEESPAYAAGLREGDMILAANGTPVRDINTLNSAILPKVREHTAVLQLSSTKGQRTVTMRWP